jgi:molecular chaperone HscB
MAADAFDVLGLAPSLELDIGVLEQRYRDLQRQLHPDKFAQASSSERRSALTRAVSVNDAYRLLKDELKRAELIFARLRGEPGDSEEDTADPELLMEVMELREELAAVRKRADLARASELRGDVRKRQEAALVTLKLAFSTPEAARTLLLQQKAGHALSRLRYYRRFQDEVDALEDDLAD